MIETTTLQILLVLIYIYKNRFLHEMIPMDLIIAVLSQNDGLLHISRIIDYTARGLHDWNLSIDDASLIDHFSSLFFPCMSEFNYGVLILTLNV